MNAIVSLIEEAFEAIPLPMLEVWGRLGYYLGFALMVLAFGGFTLRPGGRWGLGRERQAWDTKAFLSIPLTFVLIIATGYIGSFIVLVPGAQTFESLKDLVVFLCVVLFGYPALIAVPFAYGLSDLIEGVPPLFLLDWLPGYFINPTCFWIAYQLFGKNPDFRRARTWGLYLGFVLIFMAIEPVLWGYICSDKFTPALAFRTITPALFFTTGITWLIAPAAMLAALPLARKLGLFWADIAGHVKERPLGRQEWVWESGRSAGRAAAEAAESNVPIRMLIVAPFIVLVLVMVGTTAYVTLRSAAQDADRLAARLHEEIAENINLQLDERLSHPGAAADAAAITRLLRDLPVAAHGRAFIMDRSGRTIASSAPAGDPVVAAAISQLEQATPEGSGKLPQDRQFRFTHVIPKPLSRETWLARAIAYQDRSGGHGDWIVVTAMPEAYYLAGVRAGNSRSAMIFALALLLSLALAAVLASKLTAPIRRISSATRALAEGDLTQQLPGSPLEELNILTRSFNDMAGRLKKNFDDLSTEVEMRKRAEQRLRQERDYADAVINSLPGVFYHYDDTPRLLRWNRNFERISGYSPEELAGIDPLAFFVEEEKALIAGRIREVFEQGGSQVEADFLLKDGRRIPYLFTGVRFEHDGRKGFVGVGTDIEGLKKMEEALREKTALFEAQVESSPDGILVVDRHGKKVIQNQHVSELLKIPPELAGSPDDAPMIEFVSERTKNPAEFVARVAWLYQHPGEISRDVIELVDGTILDRYTGPVLDKEGRHYGRIVTFRDITERKQAEQRIRHLATHDGLTDLPNRTLIQDRLVQSIAYSRRTGRQLALLYLDLDRFKVINDGYGHPFGDAVLKAAGERLLTLVRKSDTVARQGGDEFLILLTNLYKAADAYIVARKIVESFDHPVLVQGREVHLSGSIGVAVFPQDGDTADVLIGNADVAMYRAKELGRNTYQFFTAQMSEETQRRVELETRLRGAAAAGQLELAYQPKVSLESGRISGCEALLRWRHPELGMVSPGRFIPIAEDSGLIVPIGDWVLRTACVQAKAWVDAGLAPVSVAVNISARQFLQQDVVSWVLGTLQETGLPAAQLELELTESLIAQDVEKVIATISALGAAGVKLSIDDFGTGYSSLSYLKRFRVDTLKIDQSFVRNMLSEAEDATIVLAVIALAHNLKFRVIAEGVETEEHCGFLRQHGCDEIQGYYFSRPVAAAEFEAMLRAGKRLPCSAEENASPGT